MCSNRDTDFATQLNFGQSRHEQIWICPRLEFSGMQVESDFFCEIKAIGDAHRGSPGGLQRRSGVEVEGYDDTGALFLFLFWGSRIRGLITQDGSWCGGGVFCDVEPPNAKVKEEVGKMREGGR